MYVFGSPSDGSPCLWISMSTDLCVYGSPCLRIPMSMDLRVYKSPCLCISMSRDPRVDGSPCLRIPVSIWISMSVDPVSIESCAYGSSCLWISVSDRRVHGFWCLWIPMSLPPPPPPPRPPTPRIPVSVYFSVCGPHVDLMHHCVDGSPGR